MILPSSVRPIRLDTKGLAIFSNPIFEKRSLFSRKNVLRSGSKILKRSRLIISLSTSTCEKSGLMVTSRFKDVLTAIFASSPAFNVEE
jgi:hypothetical protein